MTTIEPSISFLLGRIRGNGYTYRLTARSTCPAPPPVGQSRAAASHSYNTLEAFGTVAAGSLSGETLVCEHEMKARILFFVLIVMTVSQPSVKPTNTREPAMSLCGNARRNYLRVPSSLDLSSEIDLIASRRDERQRFSVRFRAGRYTGARVAGRSSQAVVKWEISDYGIGERMTSASSAIPDK